MNQQMWSFVESIILIAVGALLVFIAATYKAGSNLQMELGGPGSVLIGMGITHLRAQPILLGAKQKGPNQ